MEFLEIQSYFFDNKFPDEAEESKSESKLMLEKPDIEIAVPQDVVLAVLQDVTPAVPMKSKWIRLLEGTFMCFSILASTVAGFVAIIVLLEVLQCKTIQHHLIMAAVRLCLLVLDSFFYVIEVFSKGLLF